MTETPATLTELPVVLTFSGHDPSGGAGIQADIETLTSFGCHPTTVATCITAQDSCDIKDIQSCPATLVMEQARAILEDMPVKAFKIGLLASIEAIETIHSVIMDYPEIPVVLDPILASGGGTQVADDAMLQAMQSLLIPLASIITPNTREAQKLAHDADCISSCAQELMGAGAEHVLVTGTHDNTPQVINTLWGHHRHMQDFTWDRLEGEYHGSGCTLASAIAGLLAHGLDMTAAVRDAQAFTWNALKFGRRLGMGQRIPNRFFWSQPEGQQQWHKTN